MHLQIQALPSKQPTGTKGTGAIRTPTRTGDSKSTGKGTGTQKGGGGTGGKSSGGGKK